MNIEEQNLEVTKQGTSLAELSKNTQMLEETERNSSLANLEKKENHNDGNSRHSCHRRQCPE